MQELFEQVWGYVRATWRYRWYIYLLAWPIAIGGWLFVNQMPDQYESKARVFVDTSSALRPLLRGLASQSSAEEGLQMMTRTLMSRPNLEKVARMTDMDLGVSTPEEMDELITRLSNTIKFSGGRGNDKMYSISFVDEDPQLAKQTVQSLLTIFIESTLGDTRKDSDSARKFVEAQIKEYEQRLIEAENRLKEFKRKNAGRMPGEGGTYFAQIKVARQQLASAELELSEAKNLRDELRRQIEGEEPVFGIVPSSSSSSNPLISGSHPLDGRINSLEERLDELLLRFTVKHPDVAATKSTLERLKEKRANDLKEQQAVAPQLSRPTALNQNPVYQQLKISLSQAEARVASLLPRVKNYRKNLRKLESLVDTIPQIEADLKNLNRDYAINKKNYEALLARRESAKLAERAEASADDVKFRIIDPPRVPFEPSGPNRPLFETVVLIGALVAGVAFAFFLSQIKPMFDTPRNLQTYTGLPVLGYISRMWTPEEKKKRRINVISFALVGLALLGLFAGMLTVEIMDIQLMDKIMGILPGDLI